LLAGSIQVVGIDLGEDFNRGVRAEVLGQSDDIQIVANNVALDDEECLDAESFGGGGSDDDCAFSDLDLAGLEGSASPQLSKSGLDAPEAAHDGERRLRRPHRRGPPLGGLHGLEHRLIPIDEIGQDVIVVQRVAMTGVKRRGRTPNQNGVRDDRLQSGSGQKNAFESGTHIDHLAYHI
jgi:hypothetical protein